MDETGKPQTAGTPEKEGRAMTGQANIYFLKSGRGKPRCAPDPDYPNGKAITLPAHSIPSCTFELPYPAQECGAHIVTCLACGITVAVTVAGRPDDPVSVEIPCAPGGVKGEA